MSTSYAVRHSGCPSVHHARRPITMRSAWLCSVVDFGTTRGPGASKFNLVANPLFRGTWDVHSEIGRAGSLHQRLPWSCQCSVPYAG